MQPNEFVGKQALAVKGLLARGVGELAEEVE
jgi:hypothetical protein